MRFAHALASGAALIGFTVGPAFAQDYSLPPTYGDAALTAGFTPDPFTVGVVAGGRTPASTIGGCVGWVATAPDFRLSYAAGDFPLTIAAFADQDATLLINTPDGNWICDDDSGGDLNPSITWSAPLSGQYDIWVGAYAEGANFDALLAITELAGSGAGQSGGQATYGGVQLSAGFTPDPHRVSIQAGGSVDARTIASGCVGYVAQAPDYQVFYSAGTLPLIFSVASMADTTLVINAPNGEWYCDDDSGNRGMNPAVTFRTPLSGQYDVWVGTYASGALQSSTLSVSELYSE